MQNRLVPPDEPKFIPSSPGAPAGNQNAAKDDADKLSDSRTFRFKASELKAYNKAKPTWMPLRLWVRKVLNEAAGHPPPDRERFCLVISRERDDFRDRLQDLLGILIRVDCYEDQGTKPQFIAKSKAALSLNSLREQNEIRNEVSKACKSCGFEIDALSFKD